MAKKTAPAKTDTKERDPDYLGYLAEIQMYEKDSTKWSDKGRKIVRRYLDERSDAQLSASKFNILWSNTETLVPACYAKTPVPIVERRNKDKDPAARWASEVIERELTYFMDCGGFSNTMEQCVIDKLLPGRGTAWVRYVPKFRPLQVEGNQTEEDAPPAEEVYDEEAVCDYVHWQDFGHNVCRTWDEVWCVWRRVYLTRKELKARFGDEVAKTIPLDHSPDSVSKDDLTDSMKKACIYEIWDKKMMQAVWVSKGVDKCLDTVGDPLMLDGFFPTPRPMFATLANKTMFPVPYYYEYQDQAIELDNLTARITAITKALKVAGVYDVSAEGMARLLSEGVENQLIPVERYAALKDKGGLQGSFELWPLEQIADTLMKLYQARDQVKNDLYEVSGMPDIIRGSSNPSETATAQKIKGQFGSMRLRKMQDDVQRYCRDVLVLLGGICARQFSYETHRAISGVKLLTQAEAQQMQMALQQMQQPSAQPGQPPSPPPKPPYPADQLELLKEPTWEQVEALLKDQAQRGFRIEIETDSTIGGDDETEKAQRLEFIQTASGLLTQAMQAADTQPMLAPLAMSMLMFGIRSFKAARTLEGEIETTLDALKEQAQQPKPNADAQKQQADQQQAQAELQGKMQIEQMRLQGDQQNTQAKIAADAHLAQQNAQLQNQLETSKQQLQAQQAAQETALEAQRNAAERDNQMAIEQFKVQKQMELAQFQATMAQQTAIEVARINAAAKVEAARAQGVKDEADAESFVQNQESQ